MRVKIQGDREGKYSNKESCTRLVKYLHHKYGYTNLASS